MSGAPEIIAVEGVAGDPLIAASRVLIAGRRGHPAGFSGWDGSGVFAEITVTEEIAGRPSARTLLLLYATDLAYRLRSEIQPALALGRPMVVAPYIDTAVAFGRAAGIDATWIADTFSFAPKPAARHYVGIDAGAVSERRGFVEFACSQIVEERSRDAAQALVKATDRHLRALLRHSRLSNARAR